LNVILVLIDSLNRHHLSAYETSPVSTPNLDRLFEKAWRFDNHFVGSLPCMPARREIFAGRKDFLWRPWGPLEPFDDRLPRLLEQRGYSTAIVTDHYHYWEEEANGYMQSFQGARLVRGHEKDFWKQPVASDEPVPRWVQNIERWRPGDWARRYYGNVRDFGGEEDFFPAKVFSSAARWLEENSGRQPFFLQVESFDVHEPFHAPEPYASMFADGADRDRFTVWPPYQDRSSLSKFMASTTEEELGFIRGQYFGKLAMVDRWFGELSRRLDESGLWESTMVILTTDHGHDLGERGVFGKQFPHFDSHANIPLFLWHPDLPGHGRAVRELTQTVDLFATVLDAAGGQPPRAEHSLSLLPLLEGAGGREALLYGTFGQGACVTDGEWTLLKSSDHDAPLNYYSSMIFESLIVDSVSEPSGQGHFIPGVELAQWQIPVQIDPESVLPLGRENFLFNRGEDPGQEDNLWDTNRRETRRMLDLLDDLMAREGAPPEQRVRLGLGRG
jgi:arylsulfatase A-like enzyme